ncbi:FAD/NAD(P)-binding domain-containing protein [Daldinia vernicosa]|uniref:FAD/NAD(P)-binding domain-containing protein n=1 Tax=Daldinia vernicosa TaxID=114800 RepID=UPI0020079F2A|nr:FAD/NAD(P)-binding domain-containing protein [Daldinia vernicosa]KAI0850261.1 FAD/NAD(P)-binding domain-containing protein [Daldinia vernicosa]
METETKTETETETQVPKLRVAIIGAGIAGCCLTIGLSRNPLLDVHLYEAYPDVGVRGAGIALHGNAIKAMDLISPEIKKAYFKKSHFMANEEDTEMATQIIVGSGQNAGTLVAELGRAKGRRTIHRAHFIQGLLEDIIPEHRVHFGKRAVGMEENRNIGTNTPKVAVTFADSTAEEFDLVFGADGAKSVTRKFILGPDHPTAEAVNHDSWHCFNTLVPMREAEEVVPKESIEKVRMFCTPIGYVNGLPVDLGKTYSISCYQRDSKRSNCERAGFDADEWKNFCPEVTSLVSLLEKHPNKHWEIWDHDHASTYYRGHVAIVGDAAHATAPHAGNGAAQAIEDAAVLAGVFAAVKSKDDIDAALHAFDHVRRPRSQKVVDITRQFGRLYSLDDGERDIQSMKSQMREGGMYTNEVDMNDHVGAAVYEFKAWFDADI